MQETAARARALLQAGQPEDAVALLRGAGSDLASSAEGLSLLGMALVQTGDSLAALPFLEQAIALDPGHEDARFQLALIRFDLGHYPHVIQHLAPPLAHRRGPVALLVRALALYRSHGGLPEALNLAQAARATAPHWPSAHLVEALVTDAWGGSPLTAMVALYRAALAHPDLTDDPLAQQVPALRRQARTFLRYHLWDHALPARPGDLDAAAPETPPWLLVAAQMKSGSSFVARALGYVIGAPISSANALPTGRGSSLSLDLHTLLDHGPQPLVLHQHTLACPATVQMVQAFALPVVVVVRDLADALLSLSEYLGQGFRDLDMFGDMASWSPARRLDAVIDRFGPWMIEHHVSWTLAAREGRVHPVMVTYDTLVADKEGTLRQIVDSLGLTVTDRRLREIVAYMEDRPQETRFNKGQPGRGRTALSPAQWARLQQMVSHYPAHLDYTPLGF